MELVTDFAKLTTVHELINENPEELETASPSGSELAVPPAPNDPPWNSGVALGVWFTSVLLIAIIPAVFLVPYIFSINERLESNAQLLDFIKSDPTATILQIAAIIPAHILTFILSWFVVTRMRTFSFREVLGWRSGGMVWWHYIAIMAVFFALAVVVGNYFPEQETELTRILKSSRTAVYLVAIMATFTAPLVEEVVYRGILYSAFQRTFGVTVGVIAVTLLFALVHVPQYYESLSTIFLLTILSLTLTLVRVRTNNLLPCIILHTVFNGVQSILLIIEPYLKTEIAPTTVPSAIFHLLK